MIPWGLAWSLLFNGILCPIGHPLTDSLNSCGRNLACSRLQPQAERPQHGDIVIAEIDGEFTVKKLLLTPRPGLQAMNPDYPTLWPDPDNLQIFGVVTAFVHKTRGRD